MSHWQPKTKNKSLYIKYENDLKYLGWIFLRSNIWSELPKDLMLQCSKYINKKSRLIVNVNMISKYYKNVFLKLLLHGAITASSYKRNNNRFNFGGIYPYLKYSDNETLQILRIIHQFTIKCSLSNIILNFNGTCSNINHILIILKDNKNEIYSESLNNIITKNINGKIIKTMNTRVKVSKLVNVFTKLNQQSKQSSNVAELNSSFYVERNNLVFLIQEF